MAEAYNIPTSSMSKINRWFNARRASGQVVQPWELEAMAEGEMNALGNRQTQNRGLTLQAERDAEARRMNEVNTGLRQDEISAGKQAGLMGLAGNVGTTALMYNLLKKDPTGGLGKAVPGQTAQQIAATKAGTTVPTWTDFKPWRGTEMTNTLTSESFPAPAAYPYMGPEGWETIPLKVPIEATGTAADIGAGLSEGAVDLGGGSLALESGAGGTEAAMSGVALGSGAGGATAGGAGMAMPAGEFGAGASSAYLGPAAAGYAAPGILNAVHRDSTENLGHNLSLGLVRDRGTADFLGSVGTGAAAGAAIGSVVPVVGTAVGAIVGGAAGGAQQILKDTWLCTQIAIHVGLTESDQKDLKALRKYTLKYHREWLRAYLIKGKDLVEEINKVVDRKPFYAKLKDRMVAPVITLIKEGEMAQAFEKYRADTQALIRKYAPQLKEEV